MGRRIAAAALRAAPVGRLRRRASLGVTMWRALSHPFFPIASVIFGAAFATAALRLEVAIEAVGFVALALAVSGAVLGMRNWRVGEIERPLLADELDSLHDAVDDVIERQDALRDGLAERLDARLARRMEGVERRLEAVERRVGAPPPGAEGADVGAVGGSDAPRSAFVSGAVRGRVAMLTGLICTRSTSRAWVW